jgi:hypothetical protein
MNDLNADEIRDQVERTLSGLRDNRYGLRVAENGVHRVDGRWWVVLDVANEPQLRSEIWDAVALIEELLDQQDLKVSVTAA